MMYEQFYSFIEKPFQMVPNAKYLYLSPKHQNALSYLEYGITEGDGFVLLTGEIGTGKTTLIKKLLSLTKPDLEIAVIFSTNLDADQLIILVLNEFEIANQYQSKAFALDALYQFLVAKYKENKRVILIIDEAQNLPMDALEELRMMSNIQSDIHNLIQIALVGQPELTHILKTPALAALTQRIACHYHLNALSCEETAEYIAFRLKTAGGKPDLFAAEAVDLIYRASGGIPRTINILCETALVYGFADEVSLIERSIVEQVLKDRRSISAPLDADRKKPPLITNEEKHQTNDLIERIRQLEEKLNGLTAKVKRSSLPLDHAIPPASDESSPAGSIGPATTSAPAPLEPSLPDIAPTRAMAALRDENAQPPATASDKPSTTHDTAIPNKADPANLRGDDALSETTEQLRLRLQRDNKIVVLFGDDFIDIQPDMFTTLVVLADLLRHDANARTVIRGFADNSGVYGYNNKFGKFRANMVKIFLVGRGVNPQHIEAYGLGPPQPLSSNTSESIKPFNSGVEIEVDLASSAEQ